MPKKCMFEADENVFSNINNVGSLKKELMSASNIGGIGKIFLFLFIAPTLISIIRNPQIESLALLVKPFKTFDQFDCEALNKLLEKSDEKSRIQ